MNKIIMIAGIVVVFTGGGASYGGMRYEQSKNAGTFQRGDFQNLRNLSPEDRQARVQEMGISGGFRTGTGTGERLGGGGFTRGEIISKNEDSITVKLADGGSRIVFVSDETTVTTSAEGSLTDLLQGVQVAVNGTQNPDGSVTASGIQITSTSRPVN